MYRWDLAAMKQLPDYMKMCFKALYDITNEIGKKVYKKHGSNPADSLQKTVFKKKNPIWVLNFPISVHRFSHLGSFSIQILCNIMTDSMLQWASLCDAFLVEAKWFASAGHLPKPEEYLKNGIVSSGIHVVLVHMFFLLGEGENLDYESSGIISSVATILRLWDDLGSAKVIKLHKYMHVFYHSYTQA